MIGAKPAASLLLLSQKVLGRLLDHVRLDFGLLLSNGDILLNLLLGKRRSPLLFRFLLGQQGQAFLFMLFLLRFSLLLRLLELLCPQLVDSLRILDLDASWVDNRNVGQA